jgi:hypothetical protein
MDGGEQGRRRKYIFLAENKDVVSFADDVSDYGKILAPSILN